MSLLQSPRRPPSDALALGSHHEAFGVDGDHGGPSKRSREPDAAFLGGGFGSETDAPRVDLGRELDLSRERTQANAPAGRGVGVMVAAIVASSLTLAGIILLVRGDGRQSLPDETTAPTPITEVVSAPAELPAEPEPAEPTSIDQPNRVASQRVPTAAKAEPEPAEITPAAIAPTTPARPSTPLAAAAARSVAPAEVAPAEVAPSGGLAPGLHLPPPVFDDPDPAPAPGPAPTPPEPVDDASDPLPGIEERAPSEPRDEPGAAAPEAAARPTHAEPLEPVDVVELEGLDRHPARADRPAS